MSPCTFPTTITITPRALPLWILNAIWRAFSKAMVGTGGERGLRESVMPVRFDDDDNDDDAV